MTGTTRTNRAVGGVGAALVLALMLGAASGAYAQCAGTYHAGSGSGATHSATPSSGVHTTTSTTYSASTPSSCATTGGTANATHAAALHPAATSASAEKTGVHWERRTTGANRNVAEKKVSGGAAVKP